MEEYMKRISRGEKFFTLFMGIVIVIIIVIQVLRDANLNQL